MADDGPIRMPQLGLTMTEGTVIEWAIGAGEQITQGEVLLVIETDKIANEIEADRSGVLGEIVIGVGETVDVGTVVGLWVGAEVGATNTVVPSPANNAVTSAHDERAAPPPRAHNGRIVATPHARKLARKHDLDLTAVRGSGPKGRIKADDVLRLLQAPPADAAAGARRALSPHQRAVGKRMQQASREIPHFHLTADADIGALLDVHRRLQQISPYQDLTITHWIVSAVGMVLTAHPEFRRVYADGAYIELATSDVAVAVALDDGLIALVARNVGARTLAQNCATLSDLTARARAAELQSADVHGGSICVSNLGAYDIRYVAPIIIPGQSAIIGVGRTQAVFRPDGAGQPELRRELGIVLGCDHRVLNGTDGAALLTAVVALLEDPLRIVVESRRS